MDVSLLSPLLLAAVASGCVSTVTIRSEPPRANVYVIDEYGRAEPVGKTPAPVPVENGCLGPATTVVVVDGDEAMELTLMRGQVTPASFSNAMVNAASNVLCCGAIAAGAGAAGWALIPLAPVLAVPGFCLAGCAASTAACQLLVSPLQMWAPPERVTVDLENGTARTEPAYLVYNIKRMHHDEADEEEPADDEGEGAIQPAVDDGAQSASLDVVYVPY